MHLLNETVEFMRAHGKTPDDVRWVGSADGKYAVGDDASPFKAVRGLGWQRLGETAGRGDG